MIFCTNYKEVKYKTMFINNFKITKLNNFITIWKSYLRALKIL